MNSVDHAPPRLATQLLRRFCDPRWLEEIEGDLQEQFAAQARDEGLLKARLVYWRDVLLLSAKPYLRSQRERHYQQARGPIMLKNYVTITLRNLRKRLGYTFINVTGLAVGMACCLLILQYVSFEWSYDTFHTQADDLYRLTNDRYQNGVLTQHGVITYPSVAKAMKQDYPEVLNYTRLIASSRKYVRRGNIGFEENNLAYADSAFLSMFSFPLIEGDPRTALARPYSVLLAESTAEKYFGTHWKQAGVLGQVLTIDNRFDLTVTAVFENVPAHSHMQFDILASYTTLGQEYGPNNEDSWTNSNYMTYLQLTPGTDPAALEQKFLDFSDRYFEGTTVSGSIERFYLQPMKDIHLYSDYEYETWAHGNGTAVWALLLIAGFILVIAWVNYVNLSTARAMERAKEVGIRKVMGAQRRQLVKQFLMESILLNALGLTMALLLVYGLQSSFQQLLGITFSGSPLAHDFGVIFILLFVTGTLVSGLYPAMVLSSFRPVLVLKGQFVRSSRGTRIRKSLVVFQFAISFGLIAGTFTVYQQIQFMRNQDLGMNIDQVLVVQGPRLTPWDSTFFYNISSFKNEASTIPGVRHATASLRLPGTRTGRIFDAQLVSGASDVQYTTGHIGVDHDYFETFEMEMLAGRGFDATDHNLAFDAVTSIVINESAAHLLGFEEFDRALNEGVRYWGKEWEIVGVVTDHHQESLKIVKEPIIYMPLYSTSNSFFLKVAPDQVHETIAAVKERYLAFFPGNVFDYYFLDTVFNAHYKADRQFSKLFGLFATLGIVLACLGLFGLSALTTTQRTKEIGVRKVLGASATSILGLLVKDFVKLVGLATLVACPLTYLALTRWLASYAYHIDLGWLLFAIPALLVVVIALATVSYQSMRAALANPVKSLRYE